MFILLSVSNNIYIDTDEGENLPASPAALARLPVPGADPPVHDSGLLLPHAPQMRQSLLPVRPWPTSPGLGPDPQRGRPPQALQRSSRATRPSPPTGRRLAPLPTRPRPVRQAHRRAAGPGRSTGPDPNSRLAQAQK